MTTANPRLTDEENDFVQNYFLIINPIWEAFFKKKISGTRRDDYLKEDRTRLAALLKRCE